MSAANCSSNQLASAARDAANGIRAVIDGKPFDAEVKSDIATLAGLGTLLDALAAEISKCGGEACFARPINGVRAWVPLESFSAQCKRAERLQAKGETLELALAEILEERPSMGTRMISGQRKAQRAFEIAQETLDRLADRGGSRTAGISDFS